MAEKPINDPFYVLHQCALIESAIVMMQNGRIDLSGELNAP